MSSREEENESSPASPTSRDGSRSLDLANCMAESEEFKTADLMANADAVMSHWQVSQAFMRMAKRSKKREIKGAFLEAEQQIITNLYNIISESQLSTRRQENKSLQSPILKERPHELARLAECFPRSLLSIYLHSRVWNVQLLCHKCQKHVNIAQLRIYDLCSKHHECVALHCTPMGEEVGKHAEPVEMIELYRRYALLRSEADWTGDRSNETLFIHTMYDDPSYNRSTIETLVENRSIVFDSRIDTRHTQDEKTSNVKRISASASTLISQPFLLQQSPSQSSSSAPPSSTASSSPSPSKRMRHASDKRGGNAAPGDMTRTETVRDEKP
jgi:hypothetical protein